MTGPLRPRTGHRGPFRIRPLSSGLGASSP
nr:MAG TPA: hypothetical protein [Bacteriophage sp.]